METSGNKENRTYQESANAADHRKGTAAEETVQLSLMPVDDDLLDLLGFPRGVIRELVVEVVNIETIVSVRMPDSALPVSIRVSIPKLPSHVRKSLDSL